MFSIFLLNCTKAKLLKMRAHQIFIPLFCLSISCCVNAKVLLNFPVTENDVRFAFARCQDYYAKWNQTLRSLWAHSQYPDEPHTHCYVKCLLNRLGLIDPQTMGLHFKKLIEIWANMDLEISEMCPTNFRLDADLDGKCISYYRQWLDLREKCGDLMKYVFFERDVARPVRYRIELQSKPVGVSAREYCAPVPKQDVRGIQANPTSYDSNAMIYKCKMVCIFRHYRYIDGYGRFDNEEIMRSFDESHHLTQKNSMAVNNCTQSANALYDGQTNCRMASELRNCLQKRTDDFQKVYLYRDTNSRNF